MMMSRLALNVMLPGIVRLDDTTRSAEVSDAPFNVEVTRIYGAGKTYQGDDGSSSLYVGPNSNNMDKDGTKSGFDLGLTRGVSDAVGIPVIASGGVGGLQDLADGIKLGKADAVLAASIFHFGQYSVQEAKRFMAQQGIPMRLDGAA